MSLPVKNSSHCSTTFEWNYQPEQITPYRKTNGLTLTEQRDYIMDLHEQIYMEHLHLAKQKFNNLDESDCKKITRFVLGHLDPVLTEAQTMLRGDDITSKAICAKDNFFRYIKNGFLKVANDLAEEVEKPDYLERLGSYSTDLRDSSQTVQETQSCTLADAQKPKIKGHFYYIEDAEGKVRGYLLGTCHKIHRCIVGMNEEIKSAIAQADRLFLEIKELDLTVAHWEKKTDQMLKRLPEEKLKAALQSYTTLLKANHQCLNGTKWEELEQAFEQLPLLDALKLAFRHYDYVCEYQKGTLDSTGGKIYAGIDGWLFHQFSTEGKPINGLEPIEAHCQLVDELLIDIEEEAIMSMLEPNLEEAEKIAFRQCDWWSKGDTPDLPKNHPRTLKYRQSEERSLQFAERIYKDLMENDQGVGLYGFGTAHLYDNEGVIKALQGRGLKVIRVE
jgi:uncharacterized protein YbaP (TraB family)